MGFDISGIFDDELMNAVQTALQFVHGSGVRNSNVAIGAERLARYRGYVSLIQEAIAKLQRAFDSVLAQRNADVRISVERPARLRALNARNLTQPAHYEIAA